MTTVNTISHQHIECKQFPYDMLGPMIKLINSGTMGAPVFTDYLSNTVLQHNRVLPRELYKKIMGQLEKPLFQDQMDNPLSLGNSLSHAIYHVLEEQRRLHPPHLCSVVCHPGHSLHTSHQSILLSALENVKSEELTILYSNTLLLDHLCNLAECERRDRSGSTSLFPDSNPFFLQMLDASSNSFRSRRQTPAFGTAIDGISAHFHSISNSTDPGSQETQIRIQARDVLLKFLSILLYYCGDELIHEMKVELSRVNSTPVKQALVRSIQEAMEMGALHTMTQMAQVALGDALEVPTPDQSPVRYLNQILDIDHWQRIRKKKHNGAIAILTSSASLLSLVLEPFLQEERQLSEMDGSSLQELLELLRCYAQEASTEGTVRTKGIMEGAVACLRGQYKRWERCVA